jgi:hypothetical protein
LELIALRPEHFLVNAALTVYRPGQGAPINYVAAQDRRLRETVDPNSPRMPPFRQTSIRTPEYKRLNVFLIALNADIKFRRYFNEPNPYGPLPQDVIDTMHQTVELVREIYRKPERKDGPSELRRNQPRDARPQGPLIDPDYGSQGIGMEVEENGGAITPSAMTGVSLSFLHSQNIYLGWHLWN